MLLTKNQEFFMAVLSLRHFSPVEFRCKCGCGAGMEKMDADLLQMLDEMCIRDSNKGIHSHRLPSPQLFPCQSGIIFSF